MWRRMRPHLCSTLLFLPIRCISIHLPACPFIPQSLQILPTQGAVYSKLSCSRGLSLHDDQCGRPADVGARGGECAPHSGISTYCASW
ncbi:hypothetical protein B0H21DRAFT_764410 [Amylocystis lapponica]|nr:hypothetical protein B0H21DRAFT_764410 [Amylocystis lapponica]